jgi:hypothetical protein
MQYKARIYILNIMNYASAIALGSPGNDARETSLLDFFFDIYQLLTI